MSDGIEEGEFALYIDFQKNSQNPARVFQAASEMIKAFQQIDISLLHTIDVGIGSEFQLEDIEAGSLRVKLRNMLIATNDEGLKEVDWKKIVGPFLVAAKYKLIEKLNTADDVPSVALLDQTVADIHQLAMSTDVRHLPDYATLSRPVVAEHLSRLSAAKSRLSPDDVMVYEAPIENITFDMNVDVTRGYFDEVLIKETISTPDTMIIKVKKPDYLGTSQWQFLHEGHVIDAKILHAEWLDDFQGKRVKVNPGDALRVKSIRHTQYGHDNEIVHTKFDIIKVIEVIPSPIQGHFFSENNIS